jgi:hypothetical protein
MKSKESNSISSPTLDSALLSRFDLIDVAFGLGAVDGLGVEVAALPILEAPALGVDGLGVVVGLGVVAGLEVALLRISFCVDVPLF